MAPKGQPMEAWFQVWNLERIIRLHGKDPMRFDMCKWIDPQLTLPENLENFYAHHPDLRSFTKDRYTYPMKRPEPD